MAQQYLHCTALCTFRLTLGHYCIQDAARGRFQPLTKQASDIECPAGQYQDQLGRSSCDQASLGSFQDQTGQGSERVCPAGQYQDERGQTSCKACAPGTWSEQTRIIQNVWGGWGGGTTTVVEGSRGCTLCADGSTSNAEYTGCAACQPGTSGTEGLCYRTNCF